MKGRRAGKYLEVFQLESPHELNCSLAFSDCTSNVDVSGFALLW